MGCSPPGSSVHGISQARILEWVAISSCRRSSQPGGQTHISCIKGRFFTPEPLGSSLNGKIYAKYRRRFHSWNWSIICHVPTPQFKIWDPRSYLETSPLCPAAAAWYPLPSRDNHCPAFAYFLVSVCVPPSFQR